jgi:putative transposase
MREKRNQTMIHRSHTELFYHFAWSTHRREKTISVQWENRLYDFIKNKCLQLRCPLLESNGTDDHIHVLLRGNTNLSPAKIAHDIKGASSFMVNKNGFCNYRFGWQDGYGAFSVSPRDVDMISHYIRTQKRHHGAGEFHKEWEPEDDPV